MNERQIEEKIEREIEERVIGKIRKRGDVGFQKYGTTMDRDDLTPAQWLTHLQEELLDGAQYAERCLQYARKLEEVESLLREALQFVFLFSDEQGTGKGEAADDLLQRIHKFFKV